MYIVHSSVTDWQMKNVSAVSTLYTFWEFHCFMLCLQAQLLSFFYFKFDFILWLYIIISWAILVGCGTSAGLFLALFSLLWFLLFFFSRFDFRLIWLLCFVLQSNFPKFLLAFIFLHLRQLRRNFSRCFTFLVGEVFLQNFFALLNFKQPIHFERVIAHSYFSLTWTNQIVLFPIVPQVHSAVPGQLHKWKILEQWPAYILFAEVYHACRHDEFAITHTHTLKESLAKPSKSVGIFQIHRSMPDQFLCTRHIPFTVPDSLVFTASRQFKDWIGIEASSRINRFYLHL